MSRKRLNEVFTDWTTGDGIFTDLNTFPVPWKNTKDPISLNMVYHGNHSGDKLISPIIEKFLNSEVEDVRGKLASIIFNMYSDKWARTWEVLNAEYNPINNYDMVEHETSESTNDNERAHTGTETTAQTGTDVNAKTGTDTLTMTGTDTNRKSGTESTDHTGTDTVDHTGNTENEVSAFNSSTYQDSTKNTINTSDENEKDLTDETTYNTTDTETRNMTDSQQYGSTNTETRNLNDQTTFNDTVTDSGSNSGERELTRSGNIGVTTTQQMIQSEIDLRNWIYFNSIFEDIDKILTLSIY